MLLYFDCCIVVQDKADWTVCGSLKSRIETFKKTMPLIQDLKNPAMRDRHWQQLKDEVQKQFDETSEWEGTVQLAVLVYALVEDGLM